MMLPDWGTLELYRRFAPIPGPFPMANFRPSDRLTRFLLPPSIDEWLPEMHLARFIVEVIEGLDLTTMSNSYRGTGSPPTIRHRCWAF